MSQINIISRCTKTFLRYGRDGVELAKGIWNHTRRDGRGGLRSLLSNNNNNNNNLVLKPILLDHARQSNKVANSLLQMDKQVGLIKYYGVTEFIKQRFQQQNHHTKKASPASLMFSTTSSGNNASNQVSSLSESESSPTTTTTNNNKPAPATIAFMVTASMKEELKTRLGYDVNEIKQMTPLQASLVLNHSIDPVDIDIKLPQLENEYENQIEKERKESMESIALEQEKERELAAAAVAAAAATATTAASSTTTVVADGNDATATTATSIDSSSSSGSSKSRSVLNEDSFGDIWYEVLETNNKTGETSRVGLYLDLDEAILGKDVRQDIADNKNIDMKFEWRQISKEQLKKIYK